ncbi:hypothetical protein RHGRI_019207 [Rhododendron griersonianum]|uniref:Pentatricopeptide repeat-containing protein n=1 Tax=Rhododendron griersonianum TaxID=479676 RepID=A0AAV6JH28_9ERIC|nr:hypothetical protein RHGRI_019207 [Rhododendron griersonianum]
MKLLRVPLDNRSYRAMVMAYVRAGMLDQGEFLRREMATLEIYARREVYKALLRAYSMTGDSEGAQRVNVKKAYLALESLRQAGFEPSDNCVALILTAYETKNKLNKALDLLMELERDGIVVGKEALEASDEGKMVSFCLQPVKFFDIYYQRGSAQPKTKKGHSKIWLAGTTMSLGSNFLEDFQCLLLRPSLFSASKVAQGMPVRFGNWYEFVSSIVQLKIDCYGERITCSVLSPTLYFTWDKKGKPRLFAALVGYKDSKASPAAKGPESEGSESEASEGLSSRGFCSINAMNVKRPTRNRYSARK